MKKQLILLSILLITSTLNAQTLESNWQTSNVEIDGNKLDWGQSLRFFNSKSKIIYDIRNDSTGLYLLYEIRDEMQQMKSLSGGFSIDISVKSKPKLDASIVFPVMERQKGKPGERPGISEVQEKYRLTDHQVELSGFNHSAGTVSLGLSDLESVCVAVEWDESNFMIYEMYIPFKEITPQGTDFENIAALDYKIKTTINGIERPSMQQGMGGMRGGPGMPPNGGPPQDRPSPGNMHEGPLVNRQEMMLMFEDQSFIEKIELANN